MTYLDYVLTHTYGELPAEIRTEISAEDYARRRSYALQLGATGVVLPPSLRVAYRDRISLHPRPRPILPWFAAAGWLLAIVSVLLLLGREPRVEYIAMSSPPVIERDTVEVVQRDTVERVVYRERVLRDTVFAPTPQATMTPRYVLVRGYRVPRGAEALPQRYGAGRSGESIVAGKEPGRITKCKHPTEVYLSA